MITTSIDVNRPADQVFDYATDPTRFAEWQNGVVDGQMDGAGHSQPGDRCLTTRRIGLADRKITAELTHIEPPRTWGVRGVDGPIRSVVDLTVEPVADNRCRLTIAIDFRGHGIGRLLVPLVVPRQARKEMPGNLIRLRDRLERGA